jgi:amino acid transporter
MKRDDQVEGPVPDEERSIIAEDVRTLHAMGYAQELLRRMSGFSNFAISFSIICILAGCITSFPLGLSSVGGAAIGLGWPLGCALSLCFAVAMAQLASAFPTAGGLYHWASIVGGRGFGWVTAWFNLAGLVTVLSAINVGAYQFTLGSLGPLFGVQPESLSPGVAMAAQAAGVLAITASQALFNHRGIKLTTRLTDFSGYLIFAVSTALTASLLLYATHLDPSRLWTFTNYSGPRGGGVWPETGGTARLFFLGLLLPAYTVTGFDASAHTAEETIGASRSVPRAIIRAVVYSSLFGWLMLIAIVLAIPKMDAAAAQGSASFFGVMDAVLPRGLRIVLYVGIALAQYLCGLATVTSASRMTFAFARDGGLPFSYVLRRVSQAHRTPAASIWTVAILSMLFTLYTPVYSTITAVCTIFLYVSYGLPIALGLFAFGRRWKRMGPWSIGRGYQIVAALCIVGCAGLLYIGVQPPNDKALWITLGAVALTAIVWLGHERKYFKGPPQGVLSQEQMAEIEEAEKAVGQAE